MKDLLKQLHTPVWLFVLLLGVLVLRIPSFFEPYSYGDEMIYLVLGEAIRQKIPLYSGVHDNKPPLLYITAAVAGSLFWFKAILAIWHLVTVYVFWRLAEILFPKKKKLHKISTLIFALLTTLPLYEGNIANAEVFMIGPTMLGFYILLTRKLNFKYLFISGTLFSIATLFKVPAAFDIPAIVVYWLVNEKFNKKSITKIAKNTIILSIGFAVPILFTFIWYFSRGALWEYAVAAYLQNFGYLSTWRPADAQKPFLEKNGPLLIRAGLVALGNIILFWKRKKLSKQFIFLSSWLLFSLFAVTLSERPYPHYLIQSLPAVSLFLGMFFTLNTIEQVLVIFPLFLFYLVPVYFNFWRYPVLSYYTKFLKFTSGQMTKPEYFDTFGGETNRNYQISDFIASSTTKKDQVFVWGNSSAIYALSRRLPPGKYVADYHIRDFSSEVETLEILSNKMPKLIVILPDSSDFPNLQIFLRKYYLQAESVEGAQIWSLLGPKARSIIAQ